MRGCVIPRVLLDDLFGQVQGGVEGVVGHHSGALYSVGAGDTTSVGEHISGTRRG